MNWRALFFARRSASRRGRSTGPASARTSCHARYRQGRCCFGEEDANATVDCVESDGEGELGECSCQPDYLPSLWLPDAQTSALRRQVLRRAQLVRQRTRLKNQVHAILHRNLIPRCPATDS